MSIFPLSSLATLTAQLWPCLGPDVCRWHRQSCGLAGALATGAGEYSFEVGSRVAFAPGSNDSSLSGWLVAWFVSWRYMSVADSATMESHRKSLMHFFPRSACSRQVNLIEGTNSNAFHVLSLLDQLRHRDSLNRDIFFSAKGIVGGKKHR